jgi:hypothetical protein
VTEPIIHRIILATNMSYYNKLIFVKFNLVPRKYSSETNFSNNLSVRDRFAYFSCDLGCEFFDVTSIWGELFN